MPGTPATVKNEKPSYVAPLLAGSLLLLPVFLWVLWWERPVEEAPPAPMAASVQPPSSLSIEAEKDALDATLAAMAEQLRTALQRKLERSDARPGQAILAFKSAEACREFLARAAKAGLRIFGRLDAFNTVRVGYDSLDDLLREIMDHAADYDAVDANIIMRPPLAPSPEDRPLLNHVPFRDGMLAFLGVTGDSSGWGRGITIAILDSGIAADAAFGHGRVRHLDVGLGIVVGTGPDDGHGTAVAALAAGAAADAYGVAPAANLLSIRVTGTDGFSDTFTMAQAILAAVDGGAKIINISMGSYYESSILGGAIGYAAEHGVMIVAAAGNDQAAQLAWPAADSRVVSVGAVDALGQQVIFSNAGEQLKLTAPGYGVNTAWLDGQRVSMDGTSASAPIVAGAIAALISENPGLTATQAAQILETYASDGGMPGVDPAYGNGILNLGWTMNRNNPGYVDTAIAGQYYNTEAGTMDFVVQNRGGLPMSGLELSVNTGGAQTDGRAVFNIPLLAPGAVYVVQAPVDQDRIAAEGGMLFRADLANPDGVADAVPANNRRAGIVSPPME